MKTIKKNYTPIQLKLPVDLDKTAIQRLYEKLKSHVQKIEICGEDRNSYAKTDTDAIFMRFKKDYMKNDQNFVVCVYYVHFACKKFSSALK